MTRGWSTQSCWKFPSECFSERSLEQGVACAGALMIYIQSSSFKKAEMEEKGYGYLLERFDWKFCYKSVRIRSWILYSIMIVEDEYLVRRELSLVNYEGSLVAKSQAVGSEAWRNFRIILLIYEPISCTDEWPCSQRPGSCHIFFFFWRAMILTMLGQPLARCEWLTQAIFKDDVEEMLQCRATIGTKKKAKDSKLGRSGTALTSWKRLRASSWFRIKSQRLSTSPSYLGSVL